jgi:hypothetical protein
MVNLQQDRKGNYRARKRLPDDVRDEYQRLYGARHEAKFSAPKTTKSHEAKRAFWDWLSEVEGRIVAIRAERDGSGRSLTRIEARALAGDWYEWFTARHAEASEGHIEWRREVVHEALRSAAGEEDFERLNGEVWDMEDVRETVRPVVADIAQTEQFLALKQMPLTREARALFLDFLYEDFAAATKRLLRFTSGDYSLDKYAERFPKAVKGADSGVMPWVLFEKWIAERQPAQSTIESWRTPLRALCEHFKDRSAASITAEEASAWVLSLVTAKRSARVVKKTWLNAANTIYRWASSHKHVSHNPFADVKVTVPKKRSGRDTLAFHTVKRKPF